MKNRNISSYVSKKHNAKCEFFSFQKQWNNLHLIVLCHYLYHCVKHELLLVIRLNVNLVFFSKFIRNSILIQRIFQKNFNDNCITFIPKKSNFNSASMFMLSSLSNDVWPAKNYVLILGRNDRRIFFLIVSSFQKLTPANTSPFFASCNVYNFTNVYNPSEHHGFKRL